MPLLSKNWTVRSSGTKTTAFLKGWVTSEVSLTVHPLHQTHLCLLTGDEMKLWPVSNCHIQPCHVKQAHSPQPLWIFPEANVVTTSLKYPLNPQVILQSVHLNCLVVSQATSKVLPCYLHLPISLPHLEHYLTDSKKITGLGVIPPGNQARSKCQALAVTPGTALSPQQEPAGSWYHLLPQAAPVHGVKRSPRDQRQRFNRNAWLS